MASRSSSSSSRGGQGGRTSAQKSRSEGERARARASGGGLRSQPAEPPAGRSASTGGRADRASVRSDLNSRSSNSGRQGPRRGGK
jgi:hypothetical protein